MIGRESLFRGLFRTGNTVHVQYFHRLLVTALLFGVFQLLIFSTAEQVNSSVILDPEENFHLFWFYNSTHVTFEVRVKTRGYVGFGLSPNGNMFPADVVIGWVKDGEVYLKDYHTTGHSPPLVDKSQDWFLLHGEENDIGTVLKFTRKLNTCDKDDMEIKNSTQRVIYSYHPHDPADENSVMYHGGERRGTKSVMLLNINNPPGSLFDKDVIEYDVTMNNYTVPSNDTTYACVGHQMPDLGRKHHLISFEPIFSPGSERLVHHLVVQRCLSNHPELHGVHSICSGGIPSKLLPFCSKILVAWAAGAGVFYFPTNTGMPVNEPGESTFLTMQVHYNNPTLRSGVIDNSGVRMRLTPILREHDAGSFVLGHEITPYQVIPPHEPVFITSGYCADQCLNLSFSKNNVEEVKAFAVQLHAHTLSTGIKLRHFRNKTELPPIYDDPYYDFYFQEVRHLPEEAVIKKGDSFKLECTYSSAERTEPTFGGYSTADEMCEAFLYVYPKLDLLSCASSPDMDTMYDRIFIDDFQPFMKSHYDWNNSTHRAMFQQQIANSSYSHSCLTYNSTDKFAFQSESWKFVEDESKLVAYQAPPSPCEMKKEHC